MLNKFIFFIVVIPFLLSCKQNEEKLPLLGIPIEVNGELVAAQVRPFRFMDQDSVWVNNETFDGSLYLTDFFFTSCPTICPKVKRNMKMIYDHYRDEERVKFLSHTIDIKHDTIPVLKKYADKLGVEEAIWHFVWGPKDEIYGIARDYLSIALEDPDLPGGFDHSGNIILVDDNRHVRGFCDGTDEKSSKEFIKQIDRLLREYDQRTEQ